MSGADGTLTDVTAGMVIENDMTLIEKTEAPAEPSETEPSETETPTPEPSTAEPTTVQPESTTPEPTTQPTTIQKVDPVYVTPEGLEGYVTKPLSDIALPSDSVGQFVWQTDPATLLPAQEEANALVSFVPYDTETYNTITDIVVKIKINKLDTTPPVITGIEDGKTYCEAQTVTVTDESAFTVTVNGQQVTLDENGSFTLEVRREPVKRVCSR